MTNIQAAYYDVLLYLFDGYVEYGNSGTFPIKEITNRHNLDSNEVGSGLVSMGWVKNQRFDADGFNCAISSLGIKTIHPSYFSDLINKIIITAGLVNDWVDIIDALDWDNSQFQRAFDILKEIELHNIAEVRYEADKLWMKLNLRGLEIYRHQNVGGFGL